jgi:hypothetical protein
MVLVAVIAAGTVAAGLAAARRARGPGDPVALWRARVWQCRAAGPLTGAAAALMIPMLRASTAVRVAAACPAGHAGLCTAAAQAWVFFLVAGPALGLAIGLAGSATAVQPPGQPPLAPPREPWPRRLQVRRGSSSAIHNAPPPASGRNPARRKPRRTTEYAWTSITRCREYSLLSVLPVSPAGLSQSRSARCLSGLPGCVR